MSISTLYPQTATFLGAGRGGAGSGAMRCYGCSIICLQLCSYISCKFHLEEGRGFLGDLFFLISKSFCYSFFAECLQFVCVPLICHNFNFIAMSRDQGSSFALSLLWYSIIYCCHLFRFDANTGFHISG